LPEILDSKPSIENFDLCLSKLQQLCEENSKGENKAIISGLRKAFQDFPLPA